MSIPGTNLEAEEPIVPHLADPGGDPPPADEEEDEPIVHTVKGADGSDVVPVGTIIEQRKQLKALKKANAELSAKMKWAEGVEQRLQEVTPTLDLIRQNPKIVELAQQGTRPSQPATLQPEDDGEAQQWAQENGLITATGELDVARARRQLDFFDRRAAAQAERAAAPLRQSAAQQISAQHKQQAKGVTLSDGTKFATDESIEQAFSILPAELTADPKVAAIIPLIAAGLDRAKGKGVTRAQVPEYGEPLVTESPAGRRGPQPISQELQHILTRTGVSEKEFRSTEYVPGRHKRFE
jgi:hypothetical protein